MADLSHLANIVGRPQKIIGGTSARNVAANYVSAQVQHCSGKLSVVSLLQNCKIASDAIASPQ